MSDTFDVGHVHVLVEHGGVCRSDCPHPSHIPAGFEPDETEGVVRCVRPECRRLVTLAKAESHRAVHERELGD